MRRRPLAERIVGKFDERGAGECWPWTAATNGVGYGVISSGGKHGRMLCAHRAAYELRVGPIPDGHLLHHRCENTVCVNPAHLQPVTPKEHQYLGSTNAVKTHCPAGHEYTPENTYVRADRGVGRNCRACGRESANRRYAAGLIYQGTEAQRAEKAAARRRSRAKARAAQGVPA